MANLGINDKILSSISSPANGQRREQASETRQPDTGPASGSRNDTLALSGGGTEPTGRPLSGRIGDAGQAQHAVQSLVAKLGEQPEAALQAHADIRPAQVHALTRPVDENG